jgi:hypothetical protein
MSLRAMLMLTLVAAAVVLVMAVRTGSAGGDHTIVWTSPPAVPTSTTSGARSVPTVVPASAKPGSSAADAGPLSGLFNRLGDESRQVAGGQYSILTEIGGAIRSWVQRLLDGVSRPSGPQR